jgi:hypothetical protein
MSRVEGFLFLVLCLTMRMRGSVSALGSRQSLCVAAVIKLNHKELGVDRVVRTRVGRRSP